MKPTAQEQHEIFVKALSKEKPYLIKLDKIVEETGSGNITVTLRVYKGFVTDLVTNTIKRNKFIPPKDGQKENEKAVKQREEIKANREK